MGGLALIDDAGGLIDGWVADLKRQTAEIERRALLAGMNDYARRRFCGGRHPVTEQELADHMAVGYAAIERGRAALAEPVPAPRCERPLAREGRRERTLLFAGMHHRRGGRWS